MSVSITKTKEFIAEFKDLIIVITKFLGALATVIGLITSLYFNYVNSKAITKNTEQLEVKRVQIEVLQGMAGENYE